MSLRGKELRGVRLVAGQYHRRGFRLARNFPQASIYGIHQHQQSQRDIERDPFTELSTRAYVHIEAQSISKLKAFRSSKHASLGEQTMEASMRQAGGLISISLIRACMPINADRPCCVVSGCFATCYIGRCIAETFNYTGHSALVNKN